MRTDDDWMNPSMVATTWRPMEPKDEWIIQRMRVVVCSWMGSGGPPREWAEWRSFDSRKERDAELARLRKDTSWILRPAFRSKDGWLQVEDEEADLLRRLAVVRNQT